MIALLPSEALMEIHQLKTFVAVAREGSITRAAERLYLSQPAVSAHIKAIEETVGLTLFERTARGMILTGDGQRLLIKAEQALSSHRELLEEATRIKGRVAGRLRLGAAGSASAALVGRVLAALFERCPEVEVSLQHGTSLEVLQGIASGRLDAGLYNEAGDADADLATMEVSRFAIYLAAPPGVVPGARGLVPAPAAGPSPMLAQGPAQGHGPLQPPAPAVDWHALAALPWICPTAATCCGRAAEALFLRHKIRPGRIIHVDRESVTRTLIAGGVGVGLLHAETALEAQARGEVELICETPQRMRVLFAHLAGRAQDPLLLAVRAVLLDAVDPA